MRRDKGAECSQNPDKADRLAPARGQPVASDALSIHVRWTRVRDTPIRSDRKMSSGDGEFENGNNPKTMMRTSRNPAAEEKFLRDFFTSSVNLGSNLSDEEEAALQRGPAGCSDGAPREKEETWGASHPGWPKKR